MRQRAGIIFIVAFFSLFVLYGTFEALKLILGPSIEITSPKDLSTVDDPLIVVVGSVARAAYITINDRQIFADEKGAFTERLLLLPGYNIISVKVKDRFGKEVIRNITIYYTPTS